ncbi:hypothetical protein HAX54_048991 [Datura stramonium]|uniref:Uncharacterized protein n=1 Tax=Datura stramonium TaxID=4076 RepID=A0ABS8WME5_DATST|nr:hypothetical protein [Datura stramonium]
MRREKEDWVNGCRRCWSPIMEKMEGFDFPYKGTGEGKRRCADSGLLLDSFVSYWRRWRVLVVFMPWCGEGDGRQSLTGTKEAARSVLQKGRNGVRRSGRGYAAVGFPTTGRTEEVSAPGINAGSGGS